MDGAGKVVIVTGAAGGIGRCLCRALVAAGYALGMFSRSQAKLDALADELRPCAAGLVARAFDLRERASVAAAVAAVEAKLGPVDVLIHNAGVAYVTQAPAPDLAQFEEMLRVNYLGGVHCVAAVLPGMLARGRGHLVAVSTLGSFRGMPWSAGYSASKAALRTYLESLRPALRRRGVRVTTVYPGFVRTPMSTNLPLAGPMLMVKPETAARRILRAVARGRREVAFPLHEAVFTGVLRRLPPWAFDWFMAHVGRRILRGEY